VPKLLQFLIMIVLVIPLGGCWDNRDINHRIMPVVLGVASNSEGYKVFLQSPIPQNGTLVSKIIIGEGETINEIIDTISANMERQVDLLHVKVLLIDRNLAEGSMEDLIAGMMGSRDVSSKTLVAICDEEMESFFNRIEEGGATITPTSILDFFEKNAGWNPQVALTRIWHIYRSVHSYTRDVAVPILRHGQTTMIDYMGSAVIREGKMVDEITPNETLLYNSFNNESTDGKIEVTGSGSFLILKNSLSHESWVKGNIPFLNTTATFKVMLLETRGKTSINELKNELEVMLTKRYEVMLSNVQESGADIFGIGQLFRAEIPRKDLEDWRTDYFPQLQADIKVEVVVENTGNLRTSKN
jgi:spore germination protein KC